MRRSPIKPQSFSRRRRLTRSPLAEQVAEHGIGRVAMALELAQILARDAKRKPRIFHWLRGTLKNWRERSTESIRAELDAMRGPKSAETIYYSCANQPAPPDDMPTDEVAAKWRELIKRGRAAEAEALLDSAKPENRKPAAGLLGKVPPQPAGASTQQFPEPVYPTGQTDTKTEEPMPASKCPL